MFLGAQATRFSLVWAALPELLSHSTPTQLPALYLISTLLSSWEEAIPDAAMVTCFDQKILDELLRLYSKGEIDVGQEEHNKVSNVYA